MLSFSLILLCLAGVALAADLLPFALVDDLQTTIDDILGSFTAAQAVSGVEGHTKVSLFFL